MRRRPYFILLELAGGLLALVAMAAAGKRIRDEHKIHDPAHDLGDEIAVAFARKKGLLLETFAEASPPTTSSQRTEEVTVQQPVRPRAICISS